MCGRFELKTKFDDLPKVLKQDYPSGLDSKYETQNLIRPNDPVLVIKNEGRIKTTFMTWGFISPWAKDPLDKGKTLRSSSIFNFNPFFSNQSYTSPAAKRLNDSKS